MKNHILLVNQSKLKSIKTYNLDLLEDLWKKTYSLFND